MWGWDPGKDVAGGGNEPPKLVPPENIPSSSIEAHPVVVPNIQGFKEQFQQQQSLLTHIKETIQENQTDWLSKEKQLEVYANKLNQIKSRSKAHSKPEDGSIASTTKMRKGKSKENLASPTKKLVKENEEQTIKPVANRGKMNELRKCLEENKIKFEERAEKRGTENKKIEKIVEQLRVQVKESDHTIHELQKVVETPKNVSRSSLNASPRPRKKPVLSQYTQTQMYDKENQMRIKELEGVIIDLQDTIKQQQSVIVARTQAVTLLSEDLSKKGKSTVDDLEETRTQMREMQTNFVEIESQLQTDIDEKGNRLRELEERLHSLQAVNAETETKLSEVQKEKESLEKLLEEAKASTIPSRRKSIGDCSEHAKQIANLTKELDDSNKLMIRLRLDHKNKLKVANKTIESLKKSSNEHSDLASLSRKVDELEIEKSKLEGKIAELEEEKGNLLLSQLDFDEVKASSESQQSKIQELNDVINLKDADIQRLEELVSSYKDENNRMVQSIEDQNILIDNLNSKIESISSTAENMDAFEIACDDATQHFQMSNNFLQVQIDGLVKEKADLFDRLKCLQLSESGTFEKIEIGALECQPEEAKAVETPVPEGSNLKRKLKKVVSELKKEKNLVQELQKTLLAKDEIIADLNVRLAAFDLVSTDDGDDCNELQRKCLDLENYILQLNEQSDYLRKENIEVVHQLSEEKVRRVRAEEEVDIVKMAAEALAVRVSALETLWDSPSNQCDHQDADYMNIVIASKDTDIFNLQSALADSSTALDALKEELTALQLLLHSRDVQISDKEKQLEECQVQLQATEEKMAEFWEDIKNLRDEISQKNAKIEEMEKKEDGFVKALDGHKKLIESLENEIQSLTSEKKELEMTCARALEDCETYKVEIEKADILIKDLGTRLKDSEASLNDLYAQVKSMEVEKEKWGNLVSQLEEANWKCEESEKVLQKTWAERNEIIASKESLCLHLSDMEKNLARMTIEKETLNKKCFDLALELERANEVESNLKLDLENKSKLLDEKQAQLVDLTGKAKKLAANLKKRTQVEKELTAELEAVKRQREDLLMKVDKDAEQQEKGAFEVSEKEELLRQQKCLLLEKEELVSVNKSILSEKEQILASFNVLAEQEKESRQKIENLLSEYKKMNEQLNILSSEKLEADKQLLHEKENFERVSSDLKTCENDLQVLKNKLDELNVRIVNEENDKMKCREELNALKLMFESEEEENAALIAQQQTFLKEKEELISKCQVAEEKINQLEKEKLELLNELKLTNEKLSELIEKEELYLDDKRDRDFLIHDKENLGFEVKELSERLNKVHEELKSLETEKTLLEKRNLELENSSSDLLSRLQVSEGAILQFENQVKLLDQDNLTWKEKWDSLQEEKVREIEELNLIISNLQKQVNNFDLAFNAEVQKNSSLKGDLQALQQKLAEADNRLLTLTNPEKKKKKSVTLKTDEGDFVKELRIEVGNLQRALEESYSNVETLKAALVEKEKSEGQSHPVNQPGSLTNFATADLFTSEVPESNDDSLTWDDGWGAEGQLEQEHADIKLTCQPVASDNALIEKLEFEKNELMAEKEAAKEQFDVLQVKYSKLVKKLKEQKILIDKLQMDVKTAKVASDSGDLDAAIIEELRSEIRKCEGRENDLRKELKAAYQEKELLLKKVDVLNAGQDRFLELKERQDSETSTWQSKNAELRAQISLLEEKLQTPPPSNNELAQQNYELNNKIDGLEWRISELTEALEEKEEELLKIKTHERQIVTDTETSFDEQQKMLIESQSKLADLEEQIAMLANENEALQGILNEQRTRESKGQQSLSTWFPSQTDTPDAFQLIADAARKTEISAHEEEEKQSLLLQEEIKDLKNQLNAKDAEITRLDNLLAQTKISYMEAQNQSEILSTQLKEKLSIESRANIADSIATNVRSLEEGSYSETAESLKVRLRELDGEIMQLTEEKDAEIQELRAECLELRQISSARNDEVIQLRNENGLREVNTTELHKKIEDKELEIRELTIRFNAEIISLNSQINLLNQLLEEKTDALLKAQKGSDFTLNEEIRILHQRLSDKEAELAKVKNYEVELLTRDAEVRELRAEMLDKTTEILDLRTTLQNLQEKISELQIENPALPRQYSAEASPPGLNANEEDINIYAENLDKALYVVHQRDTKIVELTYEISELLQERDTLQLRLSSAIRENEELKTRVAGSSTGNDGKQNLNAKLTELHSVSYARDKNIYDDSHQRHKEQMNLLNSSQIKDV